MILALENLLGERHENREGKIAACTKNVLVHTGAGVFFASRQTQAYIEVIIWAMKQKQKEISSQDCNKDRNGI